MSRKTRRIQIPDTDKMLEAKLDRNQETSIMMLSSSKHLNNFVRTDFLLSPRFVVIYSTIALIMTIWITVQNDLPINFSLWLFILFMSLILLSFVNECYVSYKTYLEKVENTPDINYTAVFKDLEPPMTTQIFDVIYTVDVPDYAEAVQAPLELFSKDASEIAKYYAVVKHKAE